MVALREFMIAIGDYEMNNTVLAGNGLILYSTVFKRHILKLNKTFLSYFNALNVVKYYPIYLNKST